MRIAFTGKGGSGKSTVAALFIEYLRESTARVLAIDADINVHLGSLLGVKPDPERTLSSPDNVEAIRQHLIGDNTLIGGVEHFVKTTPPGPGSRFITVSATDPIMSRFAAPIGHNVSVMHVGTYEADDIGVSCYHGNLAILENLLSHADLGDDDWIVCDMVAGTDAFSNSLHAQFDELVVVVEPTPESVSVARKYRELAEAAGTLDTLVLIGNKVEDTADQAYIEREVGCVLTASLPLQPCLRKARQRGERPSLDAIDDTSVFKSIEQFARTSPMTPERRTAHLRDLHVRLAEQDYIRNAHGDISTQLPAGSQ